jgi:hypothetical protein
VAERDVAVKRVRDAVGVEDLVDHRRVAAGVAVDHRDLARRDAAAQQLQHARGHQLDLGALAAGGEEADRVARVHLLRGPLEQPALDVVERGARLVGVVLVHGR